jgi:hypothetical protein
MTPILSTSCALAEYGRRVAAIKAVPANNKRFIVVVLPFETVERIVVV